MAENHEPTEILAKEIELLRATFDDHINILSEILKADTGALYGVDLVIMAVINRSISLIDGFAKMIEDRNVLCANALLRLQLDNIIRMYACWLVDDPHSIAVCLLEGIPLHKIKSKDGKRLSDAYLVSQVSEIYPWLKAVYRNTSGFVHLSVPHMVAPVTEVNRVKRTMSIAVGKSGGRKWTEQEIIESVKAFAEATRSVLHLSYSWLITKEKGAEKRTEKLENR